MSNLVEHARRELELCGQTAEDPAYAQSIVAAVAAFASYGHSGGSAMCAIDQLTRLLRFENLGPLTDDPTEWFDQSEASGIPMWQNIRNSAAFSADGGKTYYLVEDPARTIHESSPRRTGQACASCGESLDSPGCVPGEDRGPAGHTTGAGCSPAEGEPQ